MRWSTSLFADAALALAALALLVLLAVPWPATPLPEGRAPPEAEPPAAPGPESAPPPAAAPATLEALFVAPAPKAAGAGTRAPSSSGPHPLPVEAPWLRYLGRSTGDDGRAFTYLKDTRSGRVILLVPGETRGGWTFVEEDALRVVARSADGLFAVPRR